MRNPFSKHKQDKTTCDTGCCASLVFEEEKEEEAHVLESQIGTDTTTRAEDDDAGLPAHDSE